MIIKDDDDDIFFLNVRKISISGRDITDTVEYRVETRMIDDISRINLLLSLLAFVYMSVSLSLLYYELNISSIW